MKKRPLIKVGVIGIILIFAGIFSTQSFPKKAYYMSHGFATPILYFEFIESPIEVYDFFGITHETIPDKEFINKMNHGNKLDFGFAFIYSIFLSFLFWSIAKLTNNKLYFIAILLSVIAFVFDILENIQLIGITDKLINGDFSDELINLQIFTWIKWISLSLIFSIYAYWLYTIKTVKYAILISLSPIIFGILSYINKGIFTELFAISISIMFVISTIYSFIYKNEQT